MIRRVLPLVLAGVLASASLDASLMDRWRELQGGLATGAGTGLDQQVEAVQEEAEELAVWRMSAFASALVAWAAVHPTVQGEAMLKAAQEFDPKLPSPYFLKARWSWRQGDSLQAVGSYVKGWIALFLYEPTRRGLLIWCAIWVGLAVGLAFASMVIVVTARTVREVVYDARELGGRLFQPANAWVFAVAVLLLPLFAGLGPVWLIVYLFALTWVYLRPALRVWAGVACLVLALVGPALGWMQDALLRGPKLADRVGTMLDERQIDFATLREFSDLERDFQEVSPFHLIRGELLRMHGEPGLAKVEFQKASLADPDDALSLVFLGNLAMEDGDTRRAIQLYNAALQIDGQNAFAYHNLSLAYDLSRRFQEGDEARAKAREIAGRDEASRGLRGRDPRIRYPRLGKADVEELVAISPQDLELAAGVVASPVKPRAQLANAFSLVFFVGGLFGLAVLLVRIRFYPPARECTKCGKMYRLEKGFGESPVYCSQCVSVFLRRDVVSIEQQTSKLEQIQVWEAWTNAFRRIAGLLFPGSSRVLAGGLGWGMLAAFLGWFFLTGALLWAGMFLPRIEPMAVVLPLQIILLLLWLAVVARSVTTAWTRR